MAKHSGNRTGRQAKRRRARHERRTSHTRRWRHALDRAREVIQRYLNAPAGDVDWDALAGLQVVPPKELHRVLMLRVPPNLEAFGRSQVNADRIVVDPTMTPNRIEVTPMAYAENIKCEIGFAPRKN